MLNNYLQILPEVKEAINNNQPIVALESTIISHGMPWPKNIETALAVEEAVRNEGAIPATIAIMNGKCLVGLATDDLNYFGKEKNIWKVSLRDMPYVITGMPIVSKYSSVKPISNIDFTPADTTATFVLDISVKSAEISMLS